MKKVKTKKTSLKKEFKKRNYLNIIAVIVIPIISIIMTTYVAEKSYQNEKRTTPPIFYLTKDSKNSNIVKIENVGGFASYLEFTKKTSLNFTLGNKKICLNITYPDKHDLWRLIPNIERKNTWFFSQTAETISNEQIEMYFENIAKTVNTNFELELLYIEDHYTLTYYDYENELHTFTYSINKGGLGVYEEKPNYEGYSAVGGMVIYSDDVIYERLKKYIIHEIEYYNRQLGI